MPPTTSAKVWLLFAGIFGATGVAMGAYHAHGLEASLTGAGLAGDELRQRMGNVEVAVRYQMFHALALLGVGVLSFRNSSVALFTAAVLFIGGTFCFSGGLYLPVFFGTALHWSIVPAGGLLLIAAWVALAVAALRMEPTTPQGCQP